MKTYAAMIAILLLAACAQLPEATGEAAQAVSSAANAVQAEQVDEIMNQEINIPIWAFAIFGLACWCIRTPWGLIADFWKARRA